MSYVYFIISGQPVASKQKEDSDAGVVSTVALYSLKDKVGKLESETRKLSEKVQQLEREKATLTLLNTETRYAFCFVCSFDCIVSRMLGRPWLLAIQQENSRPRAHDRSGLRQGW